MFTVTPLLGGGTLIEGSDVTGKTGRTILISERWEAVKSARAHIAANEAFDQVVTEFFAPITEAAEAAKEIAHPKGNDWAKVTIQEETDFEPGSSVMLDMDGVLLRMLEETDGAQLRWVGEDTLVAIA